MIRALLAVLLLSIDGWGCAGHAEGSSEPEAEPFGWCCDGLCGLDPWEADTFEQCICWDGYIHPVAGTRGECKELVQ